MEKFATQPYFTFLQKMPIFSSPEPGSQGELIGWELSRGPSVTFCFPIKYLQKA